MTGSGGRAASAQSEQGYAPRTLAGTLAQIGVAALFRLVAPMVSRVQIVRAPDARYRREMLIVFNHKRDTDIPLLVHALFGPPVWLSWLGRLTFAGKSDLFLRGFLALQFPQAGPLARPLY